MTPRLPSFSRLRASSCLAGVALAAVAGSVLIATPATAAPTASGGVTATMSTATAGAAVTSGTLRVTNEGATDADYSLSFDLPTGTYFDRTANRVHTTVEGSTVHISSKTPLPAGDSLDLSFYVLGAAGVVPERCTIDGAPIAGCAPTEADPTEEAPGAAAEDAAADEAAADEAEADETAAGDPADQADPADDGASEGADTAPPVLVTSGHSDVSLRATGAARDAKDDDGLRYAESDLQPAGRYVKAGQQFVVEVPAGIDTAEVAVGLYGKYNGINACRDVGQRLFALHEGQNIVTAPHDGLVSLQNRGDSGEGTVTVRGGYAVPTLVAGTSVEQFRQQLATWTNSPFASLVGEHVTVDVRLADTLPHAAQNAPLLQAADLAERVAEWDDAVETTRTFWGLDADRAHRVHVANPSFGQGGTSDYLESRADHLSASNDQAKPHELLTRAVGGTSASHFERAVGRLYQPSIVRWVDSHHERNTDMSDELAVAVLDERRGGHSSLDSWRQKAQQFRSTPVGQRDFFSNRLNDRTRELMFDQLRRAFGEDFYAEVATRSRTSDEVAGADADRREFVRTASEVAGHDLTPFFQQWGVTVEADLRADLATLPALPADRPIWDNFDWRHPITVG